MEVIALVNRPSRSTWRRIWPGSSDGARSPPVVWPCVYGLSRRSRGGACLAAAGTTLLYRGATGHCPVYSTLGVTTGREIADDTRVALGGDRGIQRARVHPAREAAGRGVPILAPLRKPAALHDEPPGGQRPRQRTFALGGEGPGRDGRRVGRRNHQRGREQGHRLADAAGRRSGERRARCIFDSVRGGSYHATVGSPSIRASGRPRRRVAGAARSAANRRRRFARICAASSSCSRPARFPSAPTRLVQRHNTHGKQRTRTA